jgi:hypothetical protein
MYGQHRRSADHEAARDLQRLWLAAMLRGLSSITVGHYGTASNRLIGPQTPNPIQSGGTGPCDPRSVRVVDNRKMRNTVHARNGRDAIILRPTVGGPASLWSLSATPERLHESNQSVLLKVTMTKSLPPETV